LWAGLCRGAIYLVTTDDETTTDYWLTRVDPRKVTLQFDDIARIPFAARAWRSMARASGPTIASKIRSFRSRGRIESDAFEPQRGSAQPNEARI